MAWRDRMVSGSKSDLGGKHFCRVEPTQFDLAISAVPRKPGGNLRLEGGTCFTSKISSSKHISIELNLFVS